MISIWESRKKKNPKNLNNERGAKAPFHIPQGDWK